MTRTRVLHVKPCSWAMAENLWDRGLFLPFPRPENLVTTVARWWIPCHHVETFVTNCCANSPFLVNCSSTCLPTSCEMAKTKNTIPLHRQLLRVSPGTLSTPRTRRATVSGERMAKHHVDQPLALPYSIRNEQPRGEGVRISYCKRRTNS